MTCHFSCCILIQLLSSSPSDKPFGVSLLLLWGHLFSVLSLPRGTRTQTSDLHTSARFTLKTHTSEFHMLTPVESRNTPRVFTIHLWFKAQPSNSESFPSGQRRCSSWKHMLLWFQCFCFRSRMIFLMESEINIKNACDISPLSPLTLNSCIMLFVSVHFRLVPAGETHDCIKAWKQVLFVPPTGTGVILISAPLCCWQTLSSMMDGPVWGRVRRAVAECPSSINPPSVTAVFGRSSQWWRGLWWWMQTLRASLHCSSFCGQCRSQIWWNTSALWAACASVTRDKTGHVLRHFFLLYFNLNIIHLWYF